MAKKKKNQGHQGIADSGIRKPIVTIMGHVDHGKTQTLDTIRNSTVVDREAGAITQSIGASIVPFETINRICGALLKKVNMELTLPGLLFIDTPGHAAFTNLRKRGGNLADIAILVIDINEGLKPQTIEAIEILKTYKTPFVIALNKVDLISGWRKSDGSLIDEIKSQSQQTQLMLEQKLYEVVGKLSEFGLESDRYDRVADYTKQIALIPTCAKSGEGIPELLMILTGLAQKFLNEKLELHEDEAGKGTILEVKEEQGFGTTIDVILYDGKVSVNDIIVIGNMGQPITTKIKALVEPAPLTEMADKKSKFKPTKSATAACGIKISAPDIDNVIAGMPLKVATKETLESVKEELQRDIEEVLVETDEDGIVIKADSLGSLEAMRTLLKEQNIPIRKALVGDISKRDLIDAKACLEKNQMHGIVLGFNCVIPADVSGIAEEAGITVLTNKVIYRLLEDYDAWKKRLEAKMNAEALDKIVRPFKCLLMPNHVFRQSGPAVVGLEVVGGTMIPNVGLLKKDGSKAGFLKGIQIDKKNVNKAEKNKQVAGSIEGVTVGRQVNEGDTLYLDMAPDDFRELKNLKKLLEPEEIEILKEIAEIKRKDNTLWGV